MYGRCRAIIENHRIGGQPMGFGRRSCPAGTVTATLSSMRISGHIIGLLKEYMRDLVEQARQESQAQHVWLFRTPYQPDHAIADLLSILDDRIESEGLQVGMPLEFLHEMWRHCNEARSQVMEQGGWNRILARRVHPRLGFEVDLCRIDHPSRIGCEQE